jgi:hypothetical protein
LSLCPLGWLKLSNTNVPSQVNSVLKVTNAIEDYWHHFTEEYTRPSIENQASFQATFKASPILYLVMLLPFVEAEGAFHKGVILKKQRRMWSIAFVPFF